MGVAFFSQQDPFDFGTFARAFLTLYQICAGQGWVGPPSLLMVGLSG
jgi:hypothetical protein